MKTYRCRKGCHVANQSKRCPVCGEWLLYDGDNDPQEAYDKTLRLQREYIAANGTDKWQPRTDSRTRALKEQAKRDEAKYNWELKKNNANK